MSNEVVMEWDDNEPENPVSGHQGGITDVDTTRSSSTRTEMMIVEDNARPSAQSDAIVTRTERVLTGATVNELDTVSTNIDNINQLAWKDPATGKMQIAGGFYDKDFGREYSLSADASMQLQLLAYTRIMSIIEPLARAASNALRQAHDERRSLYEAIRFVHNQARALTLALGDVDAKLDNTQLAIEGTTEQVRQLALLGSQYDRSAAVRHAELIGVLRGIDNGSDALALVKAELESERIERARMTNEAQQLQQQYSETIQDKNTLDFNLDEARTDAKKALALVEETKKDSESRVKQLQDEILAITKAKDEIADDRDETARSLERLKLEYSESQRALAVRGDDDSDARIKELSESHRVQIAAQIALVKKRDEEVQRLTIENSATSQQLVVFREQSRELNDARRDLAAQQKKVEEVSTENTLLRLQLGTAEDARKDADSKYLALLESQSSSSSALRLELERVKSEAGTKDAEIKSQQLRIQELETRALSTEKTTESTTTRIKQEVEETMKEAKLRDTTHRSVINEREAEVARLKKTLDETKAANATERSRLSEQLADAKRARDDEMRQRDEDKKTADERIKALERQLEQTRVPQATLDDASRQIGKLKEDAARNAEALRLMRVENETMRTTQREMDKLTFFQLNRRYDGATHITTYELTPRTRKEANLLGGRALVYEKIDVESLIRAYDRLIRPVNREPRVGGDRALEPRRGLLGTRLATTYTLAQDEQITQLLARESGGEYTVEVELYDPLRDRPDGIKRQAFTVRDVNIYKLPWSGHRAYVVDLARGGITQTYIKGAVFRMISTSGAIRYTVTRKSSGNVAGSSYGARAYTVDAQGLQTGTAIYVEVNAELQMQASAIGAGYARLNRLYIAVV